MLICLSVAQANKQYEHRHLLKEPQICNSLKCDKDDTNIAYVDAVSVS